MTEVEIARVELIKALEGQQNVLKLVFALERFIDAKLDLAGNLK